MIKITNKIDTNINATYTLTLPFESRQKARLHTLLDSGEEAGLFLQRGLILRGGDKLEAESGEIIEIISANEEVSTVTCKDPLLLMRASYHLGNRHVPLEVKPTYLRYHHDHVLNEMLEHLNLNIKKESAPFEPESGAYSQGYGQKHIHTHDHHQHHHNHE
ncbi:MAG: urease accessory protein UreE [Gammaproteobacteria bacterium]|nr:urease accessory protein UreE [Gammaproteobacteria bacterium]